MKIQEINSDTSFDIAFEETSNIRWLPWVGKNFLFSPNKLFILGESTYNWKPQSQDVAERISRKDHLRVLHTNHALNFDRSSKYVRNIERAIFGERHPKNSAKSNLWNSIIYHNLVLRPMSSSKERPTYSDYIAGWREFLSLLAITDSVECIVYGVEWQKIKSLRETLDEHHINFDYKVLPDSISRSKPKIITFELNNKKVKVLFIRHPSAFFSWKKWHDVLAREIDITRTLGEKVV
jgi:hypothetical protein